jgi:hypothetical protein
METRYITGNDTDFVIFIQNLGDKAEMAIVDDKFRWVVTEDDGTKYIARPLSAKSSTNE